MSFNIFDSNNDNNSQRLHRDSQTNYLSDEENGSGFVEVRKDRLFTNSFKKMSVSTPKTDAKYHKDATVNDRFKPVAEQLTSAARKIAFYGTSKSAISMTSAVVANQAYILGQSDSPFIDGLRARADFIETAAMSAASTIINFFYAVGSTLLAAGLFGQSETMNAAFTRNWMHTKVAFKTTLGSSVGGLAPTASGYFYNRAAGQVASSLKEDIANIMKSAKDSKLTTSELTRGLVAYLKTELAGAGKNGMLLAKRIAPEAIEFLTQALEVQMKGKQAEELADLQKQHKVELKNANKKDRKELSKKHDKAIEELKKGHEKTLSDNRKFFKTFSETIAADSSFDAISTSLSNTIDGISNKAKGDKGREALKENKNAKNASYDHVAINAAKNFLVANAQNALDDVKANPVKPAPVDARLTSALKEAKALSRKHENKEKLIKEANKAIAKAKKENAKAAAAEQKMRLKEATATVALVAKRVEMLTKYTKLEEVRRTTAVAQKQLDKINDSKKPNEAQAKKLEADIKKLGKEEKKITKVIAGIYIKTMKVEEKAIQKELTPLTERRDELLDPLRKLNQQINGFDQELKNVDAAIENCKQAIGDAQDSNDAVAEGKARGDLESAVSYKAQVNRNRNTAFEEYRPLKREYDRVKEDTEVAQERLSEVQKITNIENKKDLDIDTPIREMIENSVEEETKHLEKIVKKSTGKDSLFNTVFGLGKELVGTLFGRQ